MLPKISIFIFIFILCTTNLFAQEIEINVSELLQIGNLEEGPEEYLFKRPEFICTVQF